MYKTLHKVTDSQGREGKWELMGINQNGERREKNQGRKSLDTVPLISDPDGVFFFLWFLLQKLFNDSATCTNTKFPSPHREFFTFSKQEAEFLNSKAEKSYSITGTLFSFQFFLLVKNKIQRSLHSPFRVQGITTLQVVFFNRRDCPLSSSVYQLNFKRSFFRVCIILIQYLGNFLTITVSR